ncbi:MAG: DUF4430 domain-containing protein [bacterium]
MKKINIFLIIITGIIIGGYAVFSDQVKEFFNQTEAEPFKESIEEKAVLAILVIDNGEGLPQTFEEAELEEGITAFGLLERKAEEMDIVLKTKTYDMGIFIEAIGDKENGEDEKYWMYYVNNEMPMVAADKQELSSGDRVEFRFEKPSF